MGLRAKSRAAMVRASNHFGDAMGATTKRETYILGDGTGRFDDPDDKTRFLARKDEDSPVESFPLGMNAILDPWDGCPIYVGWDGGERCILGMIRQALNSQGINNKRYNPADQRLHGWNLKESIPDWSCVAIGTVSNPSTIVAVLDHSYFDETYTFQVFLRKQADLASYIPGSNLQRIAMVSALPDKTLQVTVSTPKNRTIAIKPADVLECTAGLAPRARPIAIWLLGNGQTSVTPADRYMDARDLFNLLLPRVNYAATTDPTVDDDSSKGYGVQSRWTNNTSDDEFVCVDATVGAAVWKKTTGSSGGMTSFQVDAAVTTGEPATIENGDTLTILGEGGIVTFVDHVAKQVAIDGSAIAGINQLTGDGTAGPGSGTQALTLATVNSNVGSFTNASLTVDAKGRITAASSGTAPVTSVGASAPLASSGGTTPTISHANSGVSAGSYTNANVTIDEKGHITSASSGTAPGSLTVDWQVFVVGGSTTWTKPANAKLVRVICVAGGSGGGSGRRGGSGTNRGGGGGGAAGGVTECWYDANELASSETVTVGAGGAGGAAIGADNTNGNNGASGGDSFFGGSSVSDAIQAALATLSSGGGASGTSVATSAGGTGITTLGPAMQFYGANGGGGVTSGSAVAGGVSAYGPGAGGGGAGRAVAVAGTPGAGGKSSSARFGGVASGGGGAAGNPSGTVAGTVGSPGTVDRTDTLTFGAGGGGGATSAAGVAGAGGNGGFPGGGGGGGGASDNGNNSGKGGDGGNGVVIVASYCFA